MLSPPGRPGHRRHAADNTTARPAAFIVQPVETTKRSDDRNHPAWPLMREQTEAITKVLAALASKHKPRTGRPGVLSVCSWGNPQPLVETPGPAF
jgi:hypothetical protein